MRRAILLPAVLAALSLGACGKKDDAAAPGAAGSTGSAVSAADPWPLVAPLLVGNGSRSYTGGCTRTPQLDTVEASIRLDADGKMTAPDLTLDMRKPQLITLTRETVNGVVKAGAMLSMEAEKGPVLTLSDQAGPEGGSAGLMRGEQLLSCPKGPGLDQLRGQPLYKSMARFIETPGVALKCFNPANPMEAKTAEYKLAGGIATVGSDSFDLSRATTEMVMIMPGENQVTYAFQVSDGPMFHVTYDTAGKLIGVQRRDAGASLQGCQADA
ncbi:hypothetical protein [Massilia sp.]|uniref:hypothetical protein n=1 Tax=Massilia sp. TaxID=1882437 RepID=UPI0028AD43F9|nr:hypothetical protein [Massilia sp.]